jgi:hypothetical protein
MKGLEKISLSKLESMYNMAASHLITDDQSRKADSLDTKGVKQAIDKYFGDTFDLSLNNHAKKLIRSELTDIERSHFIGDMGTLLRRNSTTMIPNGKVLARILHGISTPAYNVQQWGGCGCWGRYKNVDFNELVRIAIKFYISFKNKEK